MRVQKALPLRSATCEAIKSGGLVSVALVFRVVIAFSPFQALWFLDTPQQKAARSEPVPSPEGGTGNTGSEANGAGSPLTVRRARAMSGVEG